MKKFINTKESIVSVNSIIGVDIWDNSMVCICAPSIMVMIRTNTDHDFIAGRYNTMGEAIEAKNKIYEELTKEETSND